MILSCIIYSKDRDPQDGEHDPCCPIQGHGAGSVGEFCGDLCPEQCGQDAEEQALQIWYAADGKMTDGPCKSGKSHDEHAGTHSGLQLISQNTGQDQEHHHPAARADKTADESDDGPAGHGLDDPFSVADSVHGFFRGHDRFYDEFDPEQQGHGYGKTLHRGIGYQACYETAR